MVGALFRILGGCIIGHRHTVEWDKFCARIVFILRYIKVLLDDSEFKLNCYLGRSFKYELITYQISLCSLLILTSPRVRRHRRSGVFLEASVSVINLVLLVSV